MKPFYTAVLVIFATVAFSTVLIAEISTGFFSSRLLSQSSLPAQVVSSVGNPGYVPPVSISIISSEQKGNGIILRIELSSLSDTVETGVVRISGFPENMFSQQSDTFYINPGNNVFEKTISGVSGNGNCKITASFHTLAGVLVSRTEHYFYFYR